MPSETWQLVFSVIGAVAVGVTAFARRWDGKHRLSSQGDRCTSLTPSVAGRPVGGFSPSVVQSWREPSPEPDRSLIVRPPSAPDFCSAPCARERCNTKSRASSPLADFETKARLRLYKGGRVADDLQLAPFVELVTGSP